MAIIFMDSYDHYTSLSERGWINYGTSISPGITASYGRYSTAGIAVNDWGRGGYLPLGADNSSGGVAFAFYMSAWPNPDRELMSLMDGLTKQVGLYISTVGVLYVKGGAGTNLGNIATLPRSTWIHLELTTTISTTVGTVTVCVNGVNLLSLTSKNTQASGAAQFNAIGLMQGSSGGGGTDNRFDDLIVYSGTTFVGDLRVQYLAPSNAGIRTNFTPLSDANWSNVDDATPNDNDYNSSNVVGATDLFAMPNIGNGVVHGVQTVLRYKKDDAGFRTVQPVFYRADVDDGGLPPPSTTPRWYRGTKASVYDSFWKSYQVLNTSPLSGLSWTKDEINALQFGYAVGDAAMFTIDASVV